MKCIKFPSLNIAIEGEDGGYGSMYSRAFAVASASSSSTSVSAFASTSESSSTSVSNSSEDDSNVSAGEGDELYNEAINLVKSEGKASTSFLQRKLQIGYNRAARIIDMMEEKGVVSKANHVGKREVL